MKGSKSERRKHTRVAIPCLIKLVNLDGRTFQDANAENISDGGAFLTVPVDALPPFDTELEVAFSLPRSTPNTYMLEDFVCKARVVRHQPMAESNRAGLALQFNKKQRLMLET